MGPTNMLGERYLRGLSFQKRRDNRWELVRNPRARVSEEGEEDEDEDEEEEGEEEQGQAHDSLELLRNDFNEFRGSVFEHFNQVNSNINRTFSLQEEYRR